MNMHPGLEGGPIYLDYNATTPVDPAVVEAMLPYLSLHFGNPSSTHRYGHETRQAVILRAEQVAAIVGLCARAKLFLQAAALKAITWLFVEWRWRSGTTAITLLRR